MLAVMKHAQGFIPMPKMLSSSSDPDTSPLGCEYLLMEKVDGILLEDAIVKCTDSDSIPDSFIDELITMVTKLKSIKTYEKPLIGMFGPNMEITRMAYDGPMVGPCATYHEFLDSRLEFAIKEMNKFRKYQQLAQNLADFRQRLAKFVHENPSLNDLNFNDEMSIMHGDLNCSNVIIHPETFKVMALIDWESSSMNFDDKGFDFLDFFDEGTENSDKFQKRVKSRLDSIGWKPLAGKSLRSRLAKIVDNADWLAMYSSTWFAGDSDMKLSARIHIDTFAQELEASLASCDDIFTPNIDYQLS